MRRSTLLFWLAAVAAAQTISIPLRTRVEAFKGSNQWQSAGLEREFSIPHTAIVVCDMWDRHWCSGANRRVGELVKEMEPVLQRARAAGIQIIHAPSETMEFYKDYPQRKAMLLVPTVEPPAAINLPDPPLPIDDKSGGCDTHDQVYKAWTRQHPGLTIAPQDRISDKGSEIYSLLREKGIDTVLIMGVHTNMCVLNRTFAIKQLTRWGIRCALVRDLTDSMYDPQDRPFVMHEQGTELVIEHIEKNWAPSLTSADLLQALDPNFSKSERRRSW